MKVSVPPNPFVPDRIAFGLTARQLSILTVAAVGIWGVFLSLGSLLSPLVTGVMCAPIALLAIVAITTAPDGTPMDRYLLRALAHLVYPKLKVLAPEGVPAGLRLGAVDLGVKGVSPHGFVEQSDGTSTAIMKASGVNLRLRSEDEKDGVIEAFGRLLNSLDTPIQFLVSSSRMNGDELIAPLEENAQYLPHQLLTDSCLDYCSFLRTLVATENLRIPRRLICFKESSGGAVEIPLARRADHVSTHLREAGVVAELLEAEECRSIVLDATDPDYGEMRTGTGWRYPACR